MTDDDEVFIRADEFERYLREELRAVEGRPDDEVTDVEAPDGHLKTVAELRYDSRRALAKLVYERKLRESG